MEPTASVYLSWQTSAVTHFLSYTCLILTVWACLGIPLTEPKLSLEDGGERGRTHARTYTQLNSHLRVSSKCLFLYKSVTSSWKTETRASQRWCFALEVVAPTMKETLSHRARVAEVKSRYQQFGITITMRYPVPCRKINHKQKAKHQKQILLRCDYLFKLL